MHQLRFIWFAVDILGICVGWATKGQLYVKYPQKQALGNDTSSIKLITDSVVSFELQCITECSIRRSCLAANSFTNGTCELLYSAPVSDGHDSKCVTFIQRREIPGNFERGFENEDGSVSHYAMETDLLAWKAARDKCQQLKADLVSIESEDEQYSLWSWLKYKHRVPAGGRLNVYDNSFWLSLNDRKKEGTFIWETTAGNKPMDYNNFKLFEQKEGLYGDEDCVAIAVVFEGKWVDLICDDKARSVCEITI